MVTLQTHGPEKLGDKQHCAACTDIGMIGKFGTMLVFLSILVEYFQSFVAQRVNKGILTKNISCILHITFPLQI